MSPRVTNPREIDAVLKLPAPARYEHFIKRVVDSGEAWGLWNDGWAMGSTDVGQPTFPLWPAKEYAELSAKEHWANFSPVPISLEDLVDELLPKLEEDGVQPSIFRVPTGDATMPLIHQVVKDLRTEMGRYEKG